VRDDLEDARVGIEGDGTDSVPYMDMIRDEEPVREIWGALGFGSAFVMDAEVIEH
jgi:hypothetical protein